MTDRMTLNCFDFAQQPSSTSGFWHGHKSDGLRGSACFFFSTCTFDDERDESLGSFLDQRATTCVCAGWKVAGHRRDKHGGKHLARQSTWKRELMIFYTHAGRKERVCRLYFCSSCCCSSGCAASPFPSTSPPSSTIDVGSLALGVLELFLSGIHKKYLQKCCSSRATTKLPR